MCSGRRARGPRRVLVSSTAPSPPNGPERSPRPPAGCYPAGRLGPVRPLLRAVTRRRLRAAPLRPPPGLPSRQQRAVPSVPSLPTPTPLPREPRSATPTGPPVLWATAQPSGSKRSGAPFRACPGAGLRYGGPRLIKASQHLAARSGAVHKQHPDLFASNLASHIPGDPAARVPRSANVRPEN